MSQNPFQPTTHGFTRTQQQLRERRLPYVVAWIVCYASFTTIFVSAMFAPSSFIAANVEDLTIALIVFCLLISIAAPGDAWSRVAPFVGFCICIFGHVLIAGIISAVVAMILGELPVAP